MRSCSHQSVMPDETNSNSESIIEELREWYHSNRDLCTISTHRTRFQMKA